MDDHPRKRKASDADATGVPSQRIRLEDLWSDDEHKTLDEDDTKYLETFIKDAHGAGELVGRGFIVGSILQDINRRTGAEISKEKTVEIVKATEEIKEMFVKAWETKSFKELRNHELFRAHISNRSPGPLPAVGHTASLSEKQATVQSWSQSFRGSADETLFAILRNYLDWTHRLDDVKGSPYVNVVPIINSSGTGKSRVVDQLGKKHCLVIPMCLRSRATTGYPPSDHTLREWLLKRRKTEQELNIAVAAFLRALFCTTAESIRLLSQQNGDASLHCTFAESMNSGSLFDEHSPYRQDFYSRVVNLATKFETDITNDIKQDPRGFELENDQDVKKAANSLLEQCGTIVILSFDEAHELAKSIVPGDGELSPSSSGSKVNAPPSAEVPSNPSNASIEHETPTGQPTNFSMFSQIRKGFRAVLKLNVLGLYLSTSGKYRLISPEPHLDISRRVAHAERTLFPPITEVGFNQLALPIPHEGLTLSHVASLNYISHLGRPIFGARYDSDEENGNIRKNLLDFAVSKLVPHGTNKQMGSLVCLAARFAVEFRPINENQEGIERTLVESHMRYCVQADSRLRMVTIAPSEPLLAEAAFEYLYFGDGERHFLQDIAENLDTWGIHRGERGELVMSLIWMAARDQLVRDASGTISRRPWVPMEHSVVLVKDFIENLVGKDYRANLGSMVPAVGDNTVEFRQAFGNDCRLWCNHFIQVQDYKVINTKYLCALLSNGIGVLCAPNQAGIDLLWIGLKGDKICEDNLILILGQAKNDRRYQQKPHKYLFDAMDPIKLDICRPNRPIPIIRMVFALASRQPGVTLLEPPSRQSLRKDPGTTLDAGSKFPRFTSYDFWFAGVDPSTFGCVREGDVRYYQDLFASPRPAYDMPLPVSKTFCGKDKNLDERTTEIGEARVNMRREVNSMMMASKHHFPTTFRDLLFERDD